MVQTEINRGECFLGEDGIEECIDQGVFCIIGIDDANIEAGCFYEPGSLSRAGFQMDLICRPMGELVGKMVDIFVDGAGGKAGTGSQLGAGPPAVR